MSCSCPSKCAIQDVDRAHGVPRLVYPNRTKQRRTQPAGPLTSPHPNQYNLLKASAHPLISCTVTPPFLSLIPNPALTSATTSARMASPSSSANPNTSSTTSPSTQRKLSSPSRTSVRTARYLAH